MTILMPRSKTNMRDTLGLPRIHEKLDCVLYTHCLNIAACKGTNSIPCQDCPKYKAKPAERTEPWQQSKSWTPPWDNF
jgi:hypothetical protein